MSIKTFKARTLPEALALVRRELGPDATVLHARHYQRGWWGRLTGAHQVEIAACLAEPPVDSSATEFDYRNKYRDDFRNRISRQLEELQARVEILQPRSGVTSDRLSPTLFTLYSRLIDADLDSHYARELVEQIRDRLGERVELTAAECYLGELLRTSFRCAGPLQVGLGRGRLVALVGPTGVGKTTTIAKLAANFRLREKRSVGLITVDTYRVAAVEQLRTYADIIDLPMEVVSSPNELAQAVERLRGLDLILMDTAGRSPRDEIRMNELQNLLMAARPHEVQLVVSAAGALKNIVSTIQHFGPIRPTSLLVTKLDEALTLGHLASVSRETDLPLSYLTDGQNVPDDIAIATAERLTQLVLQENLK